LPLAADPGVRLRMQLSYLGAIREQAKQGVFEPWQVEKLEALYEKKQGWRQARLIKLLRACRTGTPACPTERIAQPFQPVPKAGKPAGTGKSACATDERTAQSFQPVPEAGKPASTGKSACATDEHQDLLRLLDEEIAFLEKEFQYAEDLNKEQAAATRDACLAPEGEQWKILLRREEHLDRAIDRKVRILLAMRKEFRKPKPPDEYWDASSPEDQAELNEMIWGDDKPSDFPWEDTMSELATATKVPPAVAPPQPAKTDERTENVYENKGSAAGQTARATARAQAKKPQACPKRAARQTGSVI